MTQATQPSTPLSEQKMPASGTIPVQPTEAQKKTEADKLDQSKRS
jgi:hypothetical protein